MTLSFVRRLLLAALLVASLGVGTLTHQGLPDVPNGTCPGTGADTCPG